MTKETGRRGKMKKKNRQRAFLEETVLRMQELTDILQSIHMGNFFHSFNYYIFCSNMCLKEMNKTHDLSNEEYIILDIQLENN